MCQLTRLCSCTSWHDCSIQIFILERAPVAPAHSKHASDASKHWLEQRVPWMRFKSRLSRCRGLYNCWLGTHSDLEVLCLQSAQWSCQSAPGSTSCRGSWGGTPNPTQKILIYSQATGSIHLDQIFATCTISITWPWSCGFCTYSRRQTLMTNTQALGTTEPRRVSVLQEGGLFSSYFLQPLITAEVNGSSFVLL